MDTFVAAVNFHVAGYPYTVLAAACLQPVQQRFATE
jgi:hypothetical protein